MTPMLERWRCRRVLRRASAGLDDPLSPRQRQKIDRHLTACAACREEADFYRLLKKTAGALETTAPPDYIWDRISLQLDEHPWGGEERITAGGIVHDILFGGTRSAVAAATTIVVAFLLLLPGQVADPSPGPAHYPRITYPVSTPTEYLALAMMADRGLFPEGQQDFYISQLTALNQKIHTIRVALARFPSSQAMRLELAQAYGRKIALYMSLPGVHYGHDGQEWAARESGAESRENYD